MSDGITTGAYIIRNKMRSTVLHIEHYNKRDCTSLLAFEQDEGNYGGQQIWWIEPLCDHDDNEAEKGMVYSITSPSSGGAIDMPPTTGTGGVLGVCLLKL